MTKRRHKIPGGKFKTYQEARKFRDDQLMIMEAFDPNDESRVQIRHLADGYQVVMRKEV